MSNDGHGERVDAQPDEPVTEPVGSLAEEAAKLLGAVSGWAREQGHDLGHGVEQGLGHGLAGAAEAFRAFDEHLATGAPECTSCPVCRTVHGLRQLNPEVKASLSTAASSLLQAASALLSTVAPDPRPAPAPGHEDATGPDGVQRIDLDDDPGPGQSQCAPQPPTPPTCPPLPCWVSTWAGRRSPSAWSTWTGGS